MRVPKNWICVVVAVAVFTECSDKAEPAFKKCQELQGQGQLTEAQAACQEAVTADPNTKAGQAAAKELANLEAAVEADKRVEADKKAQAEMDRKRRALLASTDPADWKTLAKEFPGTPEAKSAEEKLRKRESICLERSNWNPGLAIKRLGERGGQAALMSNMNDALAAHTAVGLGEACTKETERLENQVKEVNEHAIGPGEEPIKKELAADLQKLADMNKKWTKAFIGYDGELQPYLALQKASESLAEAVLKRDTARMTKCIDLAAKPPPGELAKTSDQAAPVSSASRSRSRPKSCDPNCYYNFRCMVMSDGDSSAPCCRPVKKVQDGLPPQHIQNCVGGHVDLVGPGNEDSE